MYLYSVAPSLTAKMCILLWITIEIVICLNCFCCLPTVVEKSTLKGLTLSRPCSLGSIIRSRNNVVSSKVWENVPRNFSTKSHIEVLKNWWL